MTNKSEEENKGVRGYATVVHGVTSLNFHLSIQRLHETACILGYSVGVPVRYFEVLHVQAVN